MKVIIFGTTLQAGVVAGLLAEHGHQVFWCLNEDDDSREFFIDFQDDVLNRLIQQQMTIGFLKFINFSQLHLDTDVYIFSFAASEFDRASQLLQKINKFSIAHSKLIINGSTFGLHATQKLRQILPLNHWGYLPDIIQEGNAIKSFVSSKQLIIGVDNEKTECLIHELFRPFFQFKYQYLFMPILDAEFTKLSISGMLATRISYMNDLALVSEKLGIDILNVQQGLASDSRIGSAYLSPGVGFGGENFSQDILTLSNTVSETGVKSQLLEQVWNINEQQKEILFRKLWNYYQGDLKGKIVTIWGAAFKENTPSIDNSPIHPMLAALWAQGVIVHLHDPQALTEIQKLYGVRDDLILFDDQYDALESAHALCLMTAWKQYLSPNFKILKSKMIHLFILDGRNIYNHDYVKNQGFMYQGVGHK